jgi:hypothetical protein
MPTYVVFTEEEKVRIRYHLGYLQSDLVLSTLLGISALAQPQFLVEGGMNRMPDTAVSMVRMLIGRCDQTEQQLFDAQEFIVASKVDETEINPDKIPQLQERYRYWTQKLADQFGVPINAYSAAFQAGAGTAINVPRIH